MAVIQSLERQIADVKNSLICEGAIGVFASRVAAAQSSAPNTQDGSGPLSGGRVVRHKHARGNDPRGAGLLKRRSELFGVGDTGPAAPVACGQRANLLKALAEMSADGETAENRAHFKDRRDSGVIPGAKKTRGLCS